MTGRPETVEEYHSDGSLWARGVLANGEMHGYWEWFRREGTIMRTGHFDHGEQTGEWTTYDANGVVVKVTRVRVAGEKPR